MSDVQVRWPRVLLRCAFAAVVVAVGATVGAALDAAPASAGEARVATYNMCVDFCHRNRLDTQYREGDAVEYAAARILGEPATPWMLATQETCGVSMYALGQKVGHLGHKTHFFQDNSPSGDPKTELCISTGFGDGLLTIGDNLSGELRYDIGNGKIMGCVKKQGYGFTWHACTLHLMANNTSVEKDITKSQARAAKARRDALGTSTIVGGDFNLVPNDLNPIWPYNEDIDRVDIGLTRSRTSSLNTRTDTSLERKIDYVVASQGFFNKGASASTVFDPEFSDHVYLRGWFNT